MSGLRSVSRWNLDEVFVRVSRVQRHPRLAADHEGEVLEVFVAKRSDKVATLRFLEKLTTSHGWPEEMVTDKLRSDGATVTEMSGEERRVTDHWKNNRAEKSRQPFRRRKRARFRRTHSSQKFAPGHSSVHNCFNSDRSLPRKTTSSRLAPPF